MPPQQKWCQSYDDSQKLSRSHWVDRDLATAFSGVPCHVELYRYVEWRNLAFTVNALHLDVIPTMVFYHEDYSTRFDDVTVELMNFLELEKSGDAPPFIVNKKYGDYYTDGQTRAIAALVKELSTKQTWKHLAHYFEDSGVANKE